MRNNAAFESCLYLVTGRDQLASHSLESVIQKAIQGGAGVVQLREKNASTRDFVELSLRVKQILRPFRVPLIINDRIDVALASGADGVHLGQDDMPFAKARELLGAKALIGLSVNNLAQALAANDLDCDYLGVGAIFQTETKRDAEICGLEDLKHIRRASRHKLIAIGGINLSNISQVIEHGAHGVAVCSAICSAKNPDETSSLMKQKILGGFCEI